MSSRGNTKHQNTVCLNSLSLNIYASEVWELLNSGYVSSNIMSVPSCHNFHCHFNFCSVQFSCSVMSDSLQPHGLQHTRLPCQSPSPGAYSKSCPSSWWCHPTISSSVIPFSSCFQSLPTSGFFQWVSSSHQVAKVLEFQLQHQSFQWIFRTDFP